MQTLCFKNHSDSSICSQNQSYTYSTTLRCSQQQSIIKDEQNNRQKQESRIISVRSYLSIYDLRAGLCTNGDVNQCIAEFDDSLVASINRHKLCSPNCTTCVQNG